jgi:uncharacterized protein YjbI with pentapeptide repeats
LYFNNSRFDRSFNLVDAHIGGNIGFSSSTVQGDLDLSAANVAGFVYLRDKDSFQDVKFVGAKIGGNVDAAGSTFHGKLNLNSAKVDGGVYLRHKGSFQEVELVGTDVGNSVDAEDGSIFHGELNLNSAKVDGSVYLRDKSSFQDVNLIGAEIGGDLDASGSTFNRKVYIEDADIGGAALLNSNASFHDLDLYGCGIGRSLYLGGSYFDGYANLASAKVMGTLELASSGGSAHWTDASTLDLRATSVRGIDDDENAWPNHLYLTGFTYQLPSGSGTQGGLSLADRDLAWYTRWLKSDKNYSRQPYKQVEATLRSVGRNRDADVIGMKSQDRQYDAGKPVLQVAGGLHKWTVGYGYRPEWAIPWALALILVGGIVANWLPLSVTMKVSSLVILSAQHLIPLINFGKTYADADVTSPEVKPWVRRYFYFHSLMGWVLAGLLVAALAQITATSSIGG